MMFLIASGCSNETTVSESVSVSEQATENDTDVKEEPTDIYEQLRMSTVMIYAGEIHGTGVIFFKDSENIRIATVSHLMGDNDQGIIQFYSGKTGFGDVIYNDPVSDISILNIKVKDFDAEFADSIKEALCDDTKIDTLNQNDKVYLVGSAINVASNVTTGEIGSTDYYVGDYDLHMLYLYADAMAGMSGSGCFSEDGVLIGILSAGSDNSEVLCININDYFKVLEDIQ